MTRNFRPVSRVSPTMRILTLLGWFVFVLAASGQPKAETDFDAAVALFKAKRYPEARALLEKVVAAEPQNAAACHYLGRAIVARNDDAAYTEGLKWLAKAV